MEENYSKSDVVTLNDETSNCIFCKIVNKLDKNTEILYEDSTFTVFRDIKPAAKHHYLVVSNKHIKNVKCLKAVDIPFVEEMQKVGVQILQQRGGDVNDTRFGFHWPPFNTISHLHLHVISPESEISWFQSIIFRPNSFYFATVKETIEWLKKNN